MKSGELRRALKGHTKAVLSVSWSPDGRTLASGSFDNTIRLWDVASGKLRRTLKEHQQAVRSVSWMLDGRALASGSDDTTVSLWDAASGKRNPRSIEPGSGEHHGQHHKPPPNIANATGNCRASGTGQMPASFSGSGRQ